LRTRTIAVLATAAFIVLPVCLLSGCGLFAGKVLSDAASSDTELRIQPQTAPVMAVGDNPYRFTAEGKSVTGGWHQRSATWTVLPEDAPPGFIITLGQYVDFVPTNEGQGTLRAEAKVSGLGGTIAASVPITVARKGNVPSPTNVTLDPSEGNTGQIITVTATLPADRPEGVQVLASDVWGSPQAILRDDGKGPDKVANDNVFTAQMTLPGFLTPGPTRIGVYAKDPQGNASNWAWATFTVK
jgi:hypothetical protein